MNKQVEIKHSIFSAIAKSASEVKVLGKTDRNNFDKYDFNHTITLSNGVFTAAPASN